MTDKICNICLSDNVVCSITIDPEEGIELSYCEDHLDNAIDLAVHKERMYVR